MPVVDKNQLKIWFKNLAKPVQEQFWNWIDSFYHKSEPIPKSAVENLTTDLAKKADLVGGVVPASQLPFSVNTSEVIAVGEISATENTVTLSVHSSGTNAVRINGVVLTRTFPNTFNFTPVTDGSKFLILYAINESGIFRLAEGVEDLEAVEPEIPVGALFVRRILINSAGADVELPTLTGFKEKKEDNWKVFLFSQTDAPVFLPFSDGRTSFLLLSQNSLAGNLILGGFARGQADSNWWSGKELTILNNTGSNVSLQNIAGFDELAQATFRANYVLKNNEAVKIKVLQDGDLLEVMAVSIDISGKLDKGGYTGTAQDLKNDIETKQKKLSSFDESILIEPDGNIEGNVSLFTEYFNQQVCELNFTPIQIIGVYKNGIKLLPEEFNISLPKTITIKTYSTEKIEIQYTHLKNK